MLNEFQAKEVAVQKRTYAPPQLTFYGALRDLTQNGTGPTSEAATPPACGNKSKKSAVICP